MAVVMRGTDTQPGTSRGRFVSSVALTVSGWACWLKLFIFATERFFGEFLKLLFNWASFSLFPFLSYGDIFHASKGGRAKLKFRRTILSWNYQTGGRRFFIRISGINAGCYAKTMVRTYIWPLVLGWEYFCKNKFRAAINKIKSPRSIAV